MLAFQRLGRSQQPVIRTVADLAALLDLPDALWVAAAAPVAALRADPVLLAAVDSDGDGRIRSDELRAAIHWLLGVLKDRAGATPGNHRLDLSALDPSHADSATLRDAAHRVFLELDRTEPSHVSLEDVRTVRKQEEARGLSSAGRVLPSAAGEDAELAAFLEHVVAVTGGAPHPVGGSAVTAEALDRYLAEGQAWLDWTAAGALPAVGSTEVRPLGAETEAAADALLAVADKLDQYFLLCDAVALDPALAERARVDASGTDLLDTAAATALLERAAVATPRADGQLDLAGVLNPAWRARVLALRDTALVPLLGARAVMTRADLAELRRLLGAFLAWRAGRPATTAGDVGAEVLAARVGTARFAEETRALLARSEESAVQLDGVKLLEKLILFQGGLLELANNMAAMPDLFDPTRRAWFERGRVVIDGRELDLAVPVLDAPRAERFAARSPMYILFVRVGEKGGNLDQELLVPVTAGERGHLVEGLWGVYHDLDGNEKHAFIRKIAESPISIKEALLAPFRRLGDTIQGMFDKAAADKQKGMDADLAARAQSGVDRSTADPTAAARAQAEAAAAAPAADAAAAAPAAAPAPPGGGLMGSLPLLLAGAGIALAALTTAAAYVMDVLWQAAASLADAIIGLPILASLPPSIHSGVAVVAVPLAALLVGLGVLAVPALMYAVPITIATWLRLRRRDLASLLEGSGWAVNTRLYLDRPLANRLTRQPKP